MTVRELLTTNPCIVEAYITIRGDYIEETFKPGQYVHEFGIGRFASFGKSIDVRERYEKGRRAQRFKDPVTLINKEINARAKNQYWDVLANVFPKDVLSLEVTYWSAEDAHSWRRYHDSTGYESACMLRIDCWLPADHVKEIRIETETKTIEQIDGQMNIMDFQERWCG